MEAAKPAPYTVSSLTDRLKHALESQFTKIYVEAEISGWKRYPSGHCYFTLKDSGAQISAVMFASAFARCRARESLADGAKVLVYGNITVYPPRGNYQLTVLAAKLVGEGDLMQRYLELKSKLEAEGLFERARKRELPFMPRRIGIVTSEAGAVIHDMCNVMSRRFPYVHIRLYPAQVQGSDAPRTLISGIEYFNMPAADGWKPDLLIIARGGGSFEDLFCFNDESLVRAVANSKVPVISAVGHETDFTLCDFAADVRAGTPSIAAEIAVPLYADIVARLETAARQSACSLRGRGEWFAQRLDHLSDSISAALFVALERAKMRLESASGRLEPACRLLLSEATSRLARAGESLRLLSPYGVLERGYSLTVDETGAVVRSASELKSGDRLLTRFAEGEASSVVV
jgi:exodeoxyribonuclease VII large subunit